jgi:polyisoprenoid-binding protein YceI
VPIATGTHQLGPDNGSLVVKTYREGVAGKVGHDLVMEVAQWQGAVTVGDAPGNSAVELTADPGSLEVREGLRGIKPLTDKDRGDILKNTREKVLGTDPIAFRSSSVELTGGGTGLMVRGELSIAGKTREISTQLTVGDDGHVTGTIPLTQSQWGIKPYRAMMGALKVRDDVEVVLDARLPAG